MSANQSSNPAPDSEERTVQDSRIDDGSNSQATNWETAPLPGTVDVAPTDSPDSVIPDSVITNGVAPDREGELLTLIHDLNECNDVLLSRVSQLESALSESQRMLQQSGKQSQVEKTKLAEQLSAEQLSAQQVSQNAQQQVAQVVAQLETAEQSLQRQQLVNETLLSELDNAQERVSQLEHDCARSDQQHAEEAQARVQAETTIRDLRSRLQRQQRYTLQFKAALEKSLTVTARSADASFQSNTGSRLPNSTVRPTSFSTPHSAFNEPERSGVTMPKAQRIMPWAGAVTSPFEGIDPHLENLIRSANTPKSTSDASVNSISSDTHFAQLNSLQPTEPDAEPTLDAEPTRNIEPTVKPPLVDAEAQLWQDMARVQDVALAVESSPADAAHTDAADTALDVSTGSTSTGLKAESEPEAAFEEPVASIAAELSSTGPKLNWQRKVVPSDAQVVAQSIDNAASSDKNAASSDEVDKMPAVPVAPQTIPQTLMSSDLETSSNSKTPSELEISSALGIEKEPLIQALGQKSPSDRAVVIAPYSVPAEQTASATSAYLSALDDETLAIARSPEKETSPASNPLNAQKKIGSMSAVQLPTFETAKAGSFKR